MQNIESSGMKRIWWLASYPKSGNTWIRLFLNAYVSGMPVDLNNGYAHYATGDFLEPIFQATSMAPIDKFDPQIYPYFRPAVLMNMVYAKRGADVALKTHHAKISVDGIPLIPAPLSKGAVYIIRDPRDVAISFADHMGETIDEGIRLMGSEYTHISREGRKHLFHILTSWSGHVDSWTVFNQDIRCATVKYEDMLEKPEETFRDLLPHLGFRDIDESRLEYALRETKFDNLKKKEKEQGFRETGKGGEFFRKGKKGGWQEVLTDSQIETIERNHLQTMLRFGYQPALITSNNEV